MNTYNDIMMKEYSSNNNKESVFTKDSDNIPKIRVAVRKRPLNKKEIGRSEMDIIDIRNGNTVIVKELK
jgi:kinesin family protein 2/24